MIEKIKEILDIVKDEFKVLKPSQIRTRLEETGLKEFADFMLRSHDIKKYRQEIKQKNVVSIKEATQAQEMLRKMKELM